MRLFGHRRSVIDHGFVVSVLINMLFRFEWLIVAGILFGLHAWLNLPIYFAYIVLGGWVLHAVCITIFMTWVCDCGERKTPDKPNKNPYSVGAKEQNDRLT